MSQTSTLDAPTRRRYSRRAGIRHAPSHFVPRRTPGVLLPLIWVLAVVVVGLIAVLAELLLSYQKRAHDLRSKQDPLRRKIRAHSQAMEEAVGGIQRTAADQLEYLNEQLQLHSARSQQLQTGMTALEHSVFGEGYDPDAPVENDDDDDLIQERDPDAGKVDDDDKPEDLLREARDFHRQEVEGHRTSLQRDLDVVRRTLTLLETKIRRGMKTTKQSK